MQRNSSAILIIALLLAGCDLFGKGGDDPPANTYEVRILDSDGAVAASKTLSDPVLVDLAEVSSSLDVSLEANWIDYEGRDPSNYDPTDLLLAFYVDEDGGLALLPSVSGGGGFGCGFPGDEVLEDFDGVIYATSLQSIHPSAMTELPFRAKWVDCENDYDDVSSEFADTVDIQPATSIIPEAGTHTLSGVTATGGLRIEVEGQSTNAPVHPVVAYHDGGHWYARLLEREEGDTFSGVVFSEGDVLHLVLLSAFAE